MSVCIFKRDPVGRKNKKETEIMRGVRDYLQIMGWFVVRIQQGLGAHKGIADLVAIKDGITVWIEVKTERGRLSEHQKLFADSIEKAGGKYFVVRSIDDAVRLEKSLSQVSKAESIIINQ